MTDLDASREPKGSLDFVRSGAYIQITQEKKEGEAGYQALWHGWTTAPDMSSSACFIKTEKFLVFSFTQV
ncbi:hypothetical protein GWN42_28700 [candidate division KSB1 bacterium]|nr:hypothetical protein [candidate division KSB1 bacterium]